MPARASGLRRVAAGWGAGELSPARFAVFAVLLAAVLVALGHLLVLQARPQGPTPYLDLRTEGDPIYYARMAAGGPEAPPPYRYRVLAPWLASLLPLPPLTGLAVVTYLSLFASYLATLVCCRRLGIGPLASAAGLFAAYSTTYHLYNYYDPFLTDGLGLLILALMTWALLARSLPTFFAAGLAGMLVRESVLFMVPAWAATRRWGQAGLTLAGALAVYGATRLLGGGRGPAGLVRVCCRCGR